MKLPTISGKELIQILRRKGYYIKDQKGSHVHLHHPTKRPITVPNHKIIAKGTLLEIMKVAGLKTGRFVMTTLKRGAVETTENVPFAKEVLS